MKILENSVLKVAVAEYGAELSSVYDKENEFERVWCADPAVWNRHAPILFPFVGKVKNAVYRYGGQEYAMKTQHGFARDQEFVCVEATKNQIVHSLKATEETKEIYPFDFELVVTHCLDAENPRKLHIIWEVKNIGNDKMYFTIGGHPAFNVPENLEDYHLEFPGKDNLILTLLNVETGFATPWNKKQLQLEKGFCSIGEHMEEIYGTFVFDNSQLEKVVLAKPDKTPYVTMECAGFPSLGIWTKPESGFICLEPWVGRTDDDNFTGTLEEKPDVQKLMAGESKIISYTIEFHQ